MKIKRHLMIRCLFIFILINLFIIISWYHYIMINRFWSTYFCPYFQKNYLKNNLENFMSESLNGTSTPLNQFNNDIIFFRTKRTFPVLPFTFFSRQVEVWKQKNHRFENLIFSIKIVFIFLLSRVEPKTTD
jgi:hypothetical protein